MVKHRSYNSIFAVALLFLLYICVKNANADQVRITNVDNLPLASFSGSGDTDASDLLCIYNDTTPNYTVEVSGPGGGGSFSLPRNSGGASLTFQVAFRGSSGSFVDLSANTPSSTFSAANTASQTCSGGTNATIRVRVTESAARTAPAGSYSGSISITIAPV